MRVHFSGRGRRCFERLARRGNIDAICFSQDQFGQQILQPRRIRQMAMLSLGLLELGRSNVCAENREVEFEGRIEMSTKVEE